MTYLTLSVKDLLNNAIQGWKEEDNLIKKVTEGQMILLERMGSNGSVVNFRKVTSSVNNVLTLCFVKGNILPGSIRKTLYLHVE